MNLQEVMKNRRPSFHRSKRRDSNRSLRRLRKSLLSLTLTSLNSIWQSGKKNVNSECPKLGRPKWD